MSSSKKQTRLWDPLSPLKKSQTNIVRFYDPDIQAMDSLGRRLSTIIAWDDGKLESCHDWVQVVFPLPEPSMFSSAVVIDREAFNAFRARPELRSRMRKAFARFVDFLGFSFSVAVEGSVAIHASSKVREGNNIFQVPFNHNHLRITRVLRSLRVLGLDDEATEFWRILTQITHSSKSSHQSVSKKSIEYWARAATRPLYLAPDDYKDKGQGKDFLYEFEDARSKEEDAGLGHEGEGKLESH
ncbi:hypothetical protein MMC20_003131 [Loxospora ochrophaea]|nr:hypothetical protein [Loxospora ochrophaea]